MQILVGKPWFYYKELMLLAKVKTTWYKNELLSILIYGNEHWLCYKTCKIKCNVTEMGYLRKAHDK